METGDIEIEEETEGGYDLRRSSLAIGYLYPTIVDKHDRIIDGQHRLRIDPKWPCFRLSHIETMADYLMARIIANLHRRRVPAKEKVEWLSELAEETGWNTEQMAKQLGMSAGWVRKYLPEGLKHPDKVKAGKAKDAARRAAPSYSEVVKPAPGFHVRKDADDTDRFLEGLENLGFFLRPGEKLTSALTTWCRTRKIHWSTVVTEGLKLFFTAQGEKL